jgi:hypothetical protein
MMHIKFISIVRCQGYFMGIRNYAWCMSNDQHLVLEYQWSKPEFTNCRFKRFTSQPIVKHIGKSRESRKDFLLDFLERSEKTQM